MLKREGATGGSGGGAVSGSGMDRVVERGGIPMKFKIAGGAAALLVLVLAFWWFAPRGGSQAVAHVTHDLAEVPHQPAPAPVGVVPGHRLHREARHLVQLYRAAVTSPDDHPAAAGPEVHRDPGRPR